MRNKIALSALRLSTGMALPAQDRTVIEPSGVSTLVSAATPQLRTSLISLAGRSHSRLAPLGPRSCRCSRDAPTMRTAMRRAILVALLLVLPSTALADIYMWRDDHGVKHYTN